MDKELSIKEAYKAMFIFLNSIYSINKSDEIGVLLGSMSLINDNKPIDPAMWEDWINAVEKVKKENIDINLHLNKE